MVLEIGYRGLVLMVDWLII